MSEEPKHDFSTILNYRMEGSVLTNGAITATLYKHEQAMAHWVMDSRDKFVREGLIKLGWTPPPEPPVTP